ncbi:MAG: bacteriohemerythrin [Nitrospirota bacterium]
MSFVWTDDLLTRVDDIDEQHKEIFVRLNALLDALARQKGKEEIGGFLDFLEEFVAYHFAAEEREMTGHKYPGLADHEKEHEEFKKRICALKRDFNESGASTQLVLMTVRSSCEWLVGHIKKTDKAMAGFLKQKAV